VRVFFYLPKNNWDCNHWFFFFNGGFEITIKFFVGALKFVGLALELSSHFIDFFTILFDLFWVGDEVPFNVF
jgi:hypothetical protein